MTYEPLRLLQIFCGKKISLRKRLDKEVLVFGWLVNLIFATMKLTVQVLFPSLRFQRKNLHVRKFSTFWAVAPKGQCPVGHRGEFQDLHPSFRPSIHPSFRPPLVIGASVLQSQA